MGRIRPAVGAQKEKLRTCQVANNTMVQITAVCTGSQQVIDSAQGICRWYARNRGGWHFRSRQESGKSSIFWPLAKSRSVFKKNGTQALYERTTAVTTATRMEGCRRKYGLRF